MILTLYIILLILSLVFIGLGFTIDNPVLEIGGFFILFVLGLVMATGEMQYKIQEYESKYYVYGNNFTNSTGGATYHWDYSASGVPRTADDTAYLFHLKGNVTDIYSNFNSTTGGQILGVFSINGFLGVLISVIGGFGIAISLVNMKIRREY